MDDLDTSGKASAGDGFYGCYLLVSTNPRCLGRTYIGYTVNPKRRINQHNSGCQRGGAKSTSGKGPWIPYVPPKTKRESQFQFKFRILCNMLRVCPWNRLGLTIRWLNQEYIQEFPSGLAPPLHMPIAFGPIDSASSNTTTRTAQPNQIPGDILCQLCLLPLKEGVDRNGGVLVCPSNCQEGFWHVLCLARHLTSTDTKELIPLLGTCPTCKTEILWPELLGKQKLVV